MHSKALYWYAWDRKSKHYMIHVYIMKDFSRYVIKLVQITAILHFVLMNLRLSTFYHLTQYLPMRLLAKYHNISYKRLHTIPLNAHQRGCTILFSGIAHPDTGLLTIINQSHFRECPIRKIFAEDHHHHQLKAIANTINIPLPLAW